MIGYSRLRRMGQVGLEGLGYADAIFTGINTALNVGAQAFNAYAELQKLEQQSDALKLQKQKLASEQAALAAARENAERLAQQALEADREAASAGIVAAAAAQSEVPTWVWVAGAVVVGGGAVYLLSRRKRGR